ncbi:MAG TPA: hypothetical protein VFN54_05730 [Acidimicrobiales bacterium]|nr:hypothetical protein [Acidimicrobiales bacterium]
MALLARALKGFGRFWWDFLVGDTPEIFLACVITIGLIALVSDVAKWHRAGVVILPLLVTFTLVGSVRRAVRARR